ncbi:MAG TPA: carotenoid 1,2-hydratase [Steroidobacteraceae bacterium]|nr:carotenoid 1,2-hydratase [Steroidobacteraceae bacterium]
MSAVRAAAALALALALALLPGVAPTTAATSAADTSAANTSASSGVPASGPAPAGAYPGGDSAQVVPGRTLQFPRDYGSHPQFGIEWWYVTGWLRDAYQHSLGFQITFFRVKPTLDADNPSAFTPRQLLIAHCALSDPAHGRLWQDQRIRRAGLGLAEAASGDTRVWIDDWRLERHAAAGGGSVYRAQLQADDFALDLTLSGAAPPMLNGVAGFSQKGPAPSSASEYYSEPHLAVSGSVVRSGRRATVQGEAWLDHEWASEYLDPRARGWDWVGLNLDDGGALMAFVIRDRRGRPYWAGGTLRDAAGHTRTFGPGDIAFTPLSYWRSPRSGVRYPVSERVRVGPRQYVLAPLMNDQEFDARLTSGAFYWEGAVTARAVGPVGHAGRAGLAGPAAAGAGRGYLELTGYDRPLSLR